ncbi:phosphatidylserine decarboxylase [Bradyrhizobium sp. 199]|uniref:phosphatidylserine decarboxylase n=1 Tax=Bradyrhizobium sp. 199 TaxID=2782664 RepID=UPI001FF8E7E1|nr:phosphatidylserine decarboxylase [Bradyrhizobium sp. 199]MCK1360446.1 phosphatidylserine decarboxylase [Bradyrhizobium sp. 199]
MSKPMPLPVFDRRSNKLFDEFMEDSTATYESKPRRSVLQWVSSSPTVDWLIAAYQNTRFSARKIEPFIRKHNIDMSEFESGPFDSYAAFFERRFLPGKRRFPTSDHEMGAFAEARYFAWERLTPDQHFPVKGSSLKADTLFGNAERARAFEGGPVLLARLSPVDYHHLHYVDDGMTLETDRLGSRLWTVNKNALEHQPDILFRNERSIQILETTHFGRIGMVEIGALTVGRIVQQHDIEKPFKRGDEKATFRFGGSAVAMFGEPGKWLPSDDMLANTEKGVETLVRLGEIIARSNR